MLPYDIAGLLSSAMEAVFIAFDADVNKDNGALSMLEIVKEYLS